MKTGYLTLVTLCLVGCASRTAYQTLYAVGHSTDAAVRSYNDLVVKGTLSTNGLPAVAHAYNNFQQVFAGAVIVSQFQLDSAAPSNLVWEANTVISLIASNKLIK